MPVLTARTVTREAGDQRMLAEHNAHRLQGLEAERQSWEASVRYQQDEGRRRADQAIQAQVDRAW